MIWVEIAVHVSEAPVNDELKGNMEHHHGKKKNIIIFGPEIRADAAAV